MDWNNSLVSSIMKEEPRIVINMAKTVLKRMSAFIRQIDFALDWMQIEAGRALFRWVQESFSLQFEIFFTLLTHPITWTLIDLGKYYYIGNIPGDETRIFQGNYNQTSNISCTLGNKIVDHSDVVLALPVNAAPTTSSFTT